MDNMTEKENEVENVENDVENGWFWCYLCERQTLINDDNPYGTCQCS